GLDPTTIFPLRWLQPKQPDDEPPSDPVGPDTQGTLQIEIVIHAPGTTKARRWRYTCNEQQERFESVDPPKDLLTAEQMWQYVATETTRSGNGFHNNGSASPNVFLILRDSLILNLYPERTVENIITQLSQAARGTDFYVVCDHEVPFNTLYQRKYER